MKMSKGLEALHRIANAKNHFKYDTLELVDKDFQIVQQELQRLESIDNANPSEALECLERIQKISKEKRMFDIEWIFTNEFNTIKQALINFDLTKDFIKDLSKLTNETNLNKMIKKLQEQEKVLNIINEYQVDIWLLKQCDYENYIRIRKEAMVSIGQIVNENGITLEDEITEEYFDLLKRYFK